MSQDRSRPSRRLVLRAASAALVGALLKPRVVSAQTVFEVDQITDPKATAASNMFRFEPDLVQLAPGDEVAFLNSRADHTVHSVPELWPEGMPEVRIGGKKRVEVRFEREGFYGFRCQRHGQYAMVMLVVAGKPAVTASLRETVRTMRAKDRERTGFTKLLDRYESQ